MRGAKTHADFEVIAHAHAEIRKRVALRDLAQQCEVRRGFDIDGRNAHQAVNGQYQRLAAERYERIDIGWHDARLLRLFACVHLNEKQRTFSALLDLSLQRMRKLWPVQRMDRVEGRDCFRDLVCLQAPDQMEFDAVIGLPQGRPLSKRFLDPILPEYAMACVECRANVFSVMRLGDCNQVGARCRFDGRLSRRFDPRKDGRKVQLDIRPGIRRHHGSMSDSLARRALARAAARLNARSLYAGRLPLLALLTDDERLPDPVAAARALPRGSIIIVRSRNKETRRRLTFSVLNLARNRGLTVLVADDPDLAAACGADGIHLPEARARMAAHWRARRPRFLITVSAHSLRALTFADRADAILLSSVFPTGSHPDRAAMTPAKAALIAGHSRLPVYALGGIDARSSARIRGANFVGLAAVSALVA